MDRRFLGSVKNALKYLASVNDERNKSFPLHMGNSMSSISRLSAYLHLFHHQVCEPQKLTVVFHHARDLSKPYSALS